MPPDTPSGQKLCPACGQAFLGPDESFCSQCGAEIAAALFTAEESAKPAAVRLEAPASTSIPVKTQVEGDTDGSVGETFVKVISSGVDTSVTPANIQRIVIPSTPIPSTPPAYNGLACQDLGVSYNSSRVFAEGYLMPFQFRITPLCEGISELRIELRYDQVLVARREVAEESVVGAEMDVSVPWRPTPGLYGKVPFDIFIGYRKSATWYWFVAQKTHVIHRATEPAGKLLENLRVEFHNNVTQGHAGDAHVNQTLDGLQDVLRRHGDTMAAFQRIDLPELWEPLLLRVCKYRPLKPWGPTDDVVPSEAVKDRLDIQLGNHRIHLLSATTVQLGRNRECEIMTRFSGNTPQIQDRNRELGRYHCRLEVHGNSCQLRDKGWYPQDHAFKASLSHTALNKRVLSSGGSVELPVNEHFCITLAPGKDAEYALDGRIWSCGAVAQTGAPCGGQAPANELAGLTLNAREQSYDMYLLLWRNFPLEKIDGAFAGACVCRCKEGFRFLAEGRCEWLIPGNSFSYKHWTVKVGQFKQTDL